MKKISCEMARDLMTLCVGGSASVDTQKALDEHMKECTDCGGEYVKLQREVAEPAYALSQAEERRMISEFGRRQRRKRVIIAVITSVFTAVVMFVCAMLYTHVGVVHDFFTPMVIVSADDLTLEGGWRRLRFGDGALELNGVFSRMEVSSYVDNPAPVEMRFINKNDETVLEGVSVRPNESVKLDGLKKGQPYQVEVYGEGDYFIFNFH